MSTTTKSKKVVKVVKNAKVEKTERKTPSNKAVVYKFFKKNPEKATADKALALVKNAVERTTILSWFSGWRNGRNLPAVAQ